MRQSPSSPLEERTRAFLSDLLIDVPIARAQGTPEEFLAVLERALLFHPVFQNWPSPIDGWLDEAEQLSRELQQVGTLATVMLRRSVVRMRRLDYDSALAELERVRHSIGPLSPAHLTWYNATLARVLIRQQQFDQARQVLHNITSLPQERWIALLPAVAKGELQLEANEIDAAEETMLRALKSVPEEIVEERIQVLQSLGFIFITKANAPKALDYLDQARQMVRGAGAWPEVIQMDLAVASFQVASGNPEAATLLTEALELCQEYPQPHLEPLLRIAFARFKAASGLVNEAVTAVTQAATLYARQRNVVGYVSMIVLIGNLYIQHKDYAEAYRTLALGVAIAKQRQWPVVEQVLRTHIDRLRNDVMGPGEFDSMVQEMINHMRP